MSDFPFDTKYLINEPYFNFYNAIEELGFEFESFQQENFREFIDNFSNNYFKMRISYIKRDYFNLKKFLHSLKGIFW